MALDYRIRSVMGQRRSILQDCLALPESAKQDAFLISELPLEFRIGGSSMGTTRALRLTMG